MGLRRRLFAIQATTLAIVTVAAMGGWALSSWSSHRVSVQARRVAFQSDSLTHLSFKLLQAVPHTGQYLLPGTPTQLLHQLDSDVEGLRGFGTTLDEQLASLTLASGDPALHRELEAIRLLTVQVQRNLERTAVEVRAAQARQQPVPIAVLESMLSDPAITAIRRHGEVLATLQRKLDDQRDTLKREEDQALRTGFAFWLTGLALGWLVGLLFAWRTADRILHPLLQLEKLMQAPGEDVNLAIQSSTINHAPSEIGSLIRSFLKLVAEGQELTAQLKSLASTDGLTAVGNRRRFDEGFSEEWSRGLRSGQPLSLLILDVDHFKLYNDLYGHVQGDACLKTVADVIRRQARRSSDLVCRIGGEEFAVLLPDTALPEATQMAHDILAALDALALVHGSSPVVGWITASIGVACAIPQHDDSPSLLMERADQALYIRKDRQGRHGVTVAEPDVDLATELEVEAAPISPVTLG
ncbi:GGDEF domain-containing protein [Synechococcus sp. CS-1328]|uniref:GGDEF domain-containing protein n=1 Tax=Synechococcus sp. CS-1328 TaxID=2847976 RepID=UPI00223B2C90|nr:GGDEF domain-containing protein [Synechococcus sp. CS-1328]MCT0224921.1 GGDEF domain-containing protein [Synechococcus sp. CS-1328]